MNYYRSYGKVNFYLKIKTYHPEIKKHTLDSKIIITKDYYDDIYLQRSKDTQIEYFDEQNQPLVFSHDILLRTKKYLEKKLNQEFNFKVKVIKKIPTLAGMGSASSNAAVLINWIYQEWNIKNQIPYYDIATELGSDIPFFISLKECAIIKNFGDVVIDSNIDGYEIDQIIFNNKKPSTKRIFELLDHSKINPNDLNDLEKPFFSLFPELYQPFKELKKHNNHVLLSGAGSSFVVFKKLK
ncbi:GHMP family kinase ATP-binding protein [Mycoplasma bradburyae]|uniref:4-diphosphocytidyl-2C-methyl-D-erythritol synthase n=1 Tax=Mycoplasma bradburyae TaxID=2963128 RepID=A0AAW6HRJ3_9MOLU|nr:4-diphosphocytidyl-2C-methyl-D-erythritol synthase [Mycoplasma bradburyae]MDC4183213.1 4-diphosphocytidyl-2C-methyl-D-erythritol synthase [Mycoplasma bradburyae]UTS70864.1 4-diphosphocytidyl-2C-methyl-D-erythritol synthase [Mycoplasma bradburyae]